LQKHGNEGGGGKWTEKKMETPNKLHRKGPLPKNSRGKVGGGGRIMVGGGGGKKVIPEEV